MIPWLIVREREKKNLLDPFEISSRGDRSLDWLARSIEVKGEENLDIQGGGKRVDEYEERRCPARRRQEERKEGIVVVLEARDPILVALFQVIRGERG